MKCEECGKDTDGVVCRNCGLVIDDRPPVSHFVPKYNLNRGTDKLESLEHDIFDGPLSPKPRKISKAFKPQYQKVYEDYVYIKATETISKLCKQLQIPQIVIYEAWNLFKGIRRLDSEFFKKNKLAPTYLACIKIACKIHDFPISNYDLAGVVDYQSNMSEKNTSYMEKKFNRSYNEILKLYKLVLKNPEHPNFIPFACNKLELPFNFSTIIQKKYTELRRYFKPHFRIEGYILALIYIFGGKRFNIYLKTLEKIFHTSTKTITSRKNEVLKYLQSKNNI
jgi:transcription initiation factor TFIIIB Brf1 subunit/transcription initiation factor TFIIB